MNIAVGEDYRITNDSHNLILLRKRVSDPNHHFSGGIPKITWEVEGYYRSVDHLVNRLIEKEILMSNVTTLGDLIKKVEEIKTFLAQKVNEAIEYEEKQAEETEEN
ncbi:hypothetical protein [Virgibacillus halodenitrificans]|uniref:hypothetical protein n=1 Tax=Virgibacillus halodenitrificans TaxID=1482 RepID=UPI000EF54C3D|nr:hypothetical protein [Virgibacillus halodenitrificans]